MSREEHIAKPEQQADGAASSSSAAQAEEFYHVPHKPLQEAPLYTYQLGEDDMAILLLKLRLDFQRYHHEDDQVWPIEYQEGLSDQSCHDCVKELLRHDSEAGENTLGFFFKQLPILSNDNRDKLPGWCAKYKDNKTILYGVVHLGIHWVPYIILQHRDIPSVITFESLYAKDKMQSVKSLKGFFKIAFGEMRHSVKNVDQYDGLYNGYACGPVSYELLREIFSSLQMDKPIVEYTTEGKYMCYPRNLQHNGIIHRGREENQYGVAFLKSTDEIVSRVSDILVEFKNAVLIPAEVDSPVEKYLVIAGDDFNIKVLRQRFNDVCKEIVSQLVGLLDAHPDKALEIPDESLIDALLTDVNPSLVGEYEKIGREIEEPGYKSIYSGFNAAIIAHQKLRQINQLVKRYVLIWKSDNDVSAVEYFSNPENELPENLRTQYYEDLFVTKVREELQRLTANAAVSAVGLLSEQRSPVLATPRQQKISVNEEKAQECIKACLDAIKARSNESKRLRKSVRMIRSRSSGLSSLGEKLASESLTAHKFRAICETYYSAQSEWLKQILYEQLSTYFTSCGIEADGCDTSALHISDQKRARVIAQINKIYPDLNEEVVAPSQSYRSYDMMYF